MALVENLFVLLLFWTNALDEELQYQCIYYMCSLYTIDATYFASDII